MSLHLLRRSRSRFSWSTFTPGSPEKPRPRPDVYLETRPSTTESGRRRTAATRWACIQALACEISGSSPEAELLTASTGIFATVSPASYSALVTGFLFNSRYALMFSSSASLVFTLLGPWLEKVLAAALYAPPSVADGRD